jgi:hypothetical protein
MKGVMPIKINQFHATGKGGAFHDTLLGYNFVHWGLGIFVGTCPKVAGLVVCDPYSVQYGSVSIPDYGTAWKQNGMVLRNIVIFRGDEWSLVAGAM